MQLTRSFVLPAAIAAATVLGPMVARADDTAPPVQQQQQQPQQQSFSEDQLKAYAVAALQVSAIQQEYASKIVAAQKTEPQNIQTLNDEAEGKMADAVRKRGLSVETYNNITRAARAEPSVRQRIMQFMSQPPTKTPQQPH
jgi:hypothetical protein